jgi:hypothetical protein
VGSCLRLDNQHLNLVGLLEVFEYLSTLVDWDGTVDNFAGNTFPSQMRSQ